MDKQVPTAEKLKVWLGLVASLISITLGVLSFVEKLPGAIKIVSEHRVPWWGFLGVLLLLGLWLLLRQFLAPRSRLLQPDRFVIRAEDPRHLKGREDEVRELADLCERTPLVFLEGESGSGKSALARAGLVDECLRRQRLHPIYLDLSGTGWEDRLRAFFSVEVRHALSESDRQALELKAPSSSGEIFTALGTCAWRIGRIPLLIFDQLDDYQTAHFQHFREGRLGNTWITKETLIRINSFWREIAGMVESETVHCLFITRTDNAGGLDTVRFVEAKTFRLARVSRNLIAPLLEEITDTESEGGPPVIARPQRGWEQLKRRLLRDIARDEFILPIRLCLALQALRLLPVLTVREYERHGGAEGLERLHVERNIIEAAQASGLSVGQVRKVMLSLVEPVKGKTVQLSNAELLAVLEPGSAPFGWVFSQQLQKALDHLQHRNIIRRRPAEEEGGDVWLLYHDFLCRGVMAAERHANRWHALLREKARQFQQSAGIFRRWRTLLSPWQQVRLFGERLGGRFHYAENRRFAIVSTLRFLPLLLLLAVGWKAALDFHLTPDDHKAARIFAVLGTIPDRADRVESEQMRAMASASDRVRWRVLELAFDGEKNAEQVKALMPVLLQTCLRLDTTGKNRAHFWRKIVQPALEKNTGSRVLLLALESWKAAPGDVTAGRHLAQAFLQTVKREQDKYDLRGLLEKGASQLVRIDAASVQFLSEYLLKEMTEKNSADSIVYLAVGLPALAEHLNGEQKWRVAEYFVKAILNAEERYLSSGWMDNSLQAFLPHLDLEHSLLLTEEMVQSMAQSKDPTRLGSLRWNLYRLVRSLAGEQAHATIANRIAKAILQTSDTTQLTGLMSSFGQVAKQSEPELRQRVMAKLVDALEQEKDASRIADLASAFGDQASALNAEQGRRCATKLLGLLEQEKKLSLLGELGEALGYYALWLDAAEAHRACERMMEVLEFGGRSGFQKRSLAALAVPLSEDQRVELTEKLIELTRRLRDKMKGHELIYQLKEMARLVNRDQAHAIAEKLVQTIETEKSRDQIDALRDMAQALGMTEDADLVRRVGERLVLMMEGEKFFNSWPFLTIGPSLGSDLRKRVVKHVLEALDSRKELYTKYGHNLMPVAEILSLFAGGMEPADVQGALEKLSEISMKAGESGRFLDLWVLLEPLWRKVPEETIKGLAERVASRLQQSASEAGMYGIGGGHVRLSEAESSKVISELLQHAPDQSLLDILKEPFAVDASLPLRRIVIHAFELKYSLNYDKGLWDFLQWATKDRRTKDLDFHSPPRLNFPKAGTVSGAGVNRNLFHHEEHEGVFVNLLSKLRGLRALRGECLMICQEIA